MSTSIASRRLGKGESGSMLWATRYAVNVEDRIAAMGGKVKDAYFVMGAYAFTYSARMGSSRRSRGTSGKRARSSSTVIGVRAARALSSHGRGPRLRPLRPRPGVDAFPPLGH